MNNKMKYILIVALFVLFVGLVVFGQTIPGYGGLTMQMIGLIGLLVMLFTYNKKSK